METRLWLWRSGSAALPACHICKPARRCLPAASAPSAEGYYIVRGDGLSCVDADYCDLGVDDCPSLPNEVPPSGHSHACLIRFYGNDVQNFLKQVAMGTTQGHQTFTLCHQTPDKLCPAVRWYPLGR
eukprot:Rmarinus@m.16776